MSYVDIFILAVALSIDACVVSFSNGLIFTQNKRINSLMLALAVGFFQFLMPIIGYFLATSVSKYTEAYADWIVFVIFFLLGVKFIKDAFKEEEQDKITCYLCFSYIMTVAVATSIDALGAGVSLYFSKANIWIASVLIGVITFINSLVGFWSGYVFQKFPSRNLEIAGGLILILLAFKSLLF